MHQTGLAEMQGGSILVIRRKNILLIPPTKRFPALRMYLRVIRKLGSETYGLL
jgi:hypothetical protein